MIETLLSLPPAPYRLSVAARQLPPANLAVFHLDRIACDHGDVPQSKTCGVQAVHRTERKRQIHIPMDIHTRPTVNNCCTAIVQYTQGLILSSTSDLYLRLNVCLVMHIRTRHSLQRRLRICHSRLSCTTVYSNDALTNTIICILTLLYRTSVVDECASTAYKSITSSSISFGKRLLCPAFFLSGAPWVKTDWRHLNRTN